jgi:hypothetical protein
MDKALIIAELSKHTIMGEGKIIIKEIDYSNNRFAPEMIAYRIHYTDYTGKRCKVTWYPNTVGFQWS